MAFRVEISASAQIEAEEIVAWLMGQHAGEAGIRWIRGLYDSVASLSSFPHRCAVAPEDGWQRQ